MMDFGSGGNTNIKKTIVAVILNICLIMNFVPIQVLGAEREEIFRAENKWSCFP